MMLVVTLGVAWRHFYFGQGSREVRLLLGVHLYQRPSGTRGCWAYILLLKTFVCPSSMDPAQLPWSMGLLKFKEMQGGVGGRPREHKLSQRCRQQGDVLFMSL